MPCNGNLYPFGSSHWGKIVLSSVIEVNECLTVVQGNVNSRSLEFVLLLLGVKFDGRLSLFSFINHPKEMPPARQQVRIEDRCNKQDAMQTVLMELDE